MRATPLTAIQPQVRAATLPEKWAPQFLKEYLTSTLTSFHTDPARRPFGAATASRSSR